MSTSGHSSTIGAADDRGFFSAEQLAKTQQRRPHTRFVSTLLGNFSLELPDNHFDMVSSISVLEHIPPKPIKTARQDMFHVLKPGGCRVHSLDISPFTNEVRGKTILSALENCGFMFVEKPRLEWQFSADLKEAILLEPLRIVYTYYGRVSGYSESLKPLNHYHYGTVLIFVNKPCGTLTRKPNWAKHNFKPARAYVKTALNRTLMRWL
jgi:SAM-dependent methyltransferase